MATRVHGGEALARGSQSDTDLHLRRTAIGRSSSVVSHLEYEFVTLLLRGNGNDAGFAHSTQTVDYCVLYQRLQQEARNHCCLRLGIDIEVHLQAVSKTQLFQRHVSTRKFNLALNSALGV